MNGGDQILCETTAAIEAILGPELHLITIERVVVGLFFTGVKLSNGSGGAAATPIKAIPEAVCCPSSAKAMPFPNKLRGRLAAELMREVISENSIRRAVGTAVMNALADVCLRRRPPHGVTLLREIDAFEVAAPQVGEKAVVVGAFVPFLRELKRRAIPFTVLEQDPATLKADELPYFRPAKDAELVIPDADVVLITGTTLINRTLDHLLSLPKPGARVAVIGPTVSLLPDALMHRGASILGTILINDVDAFLDVLAEGGSGYHFFGRSAERVVLIPSVAKGREGEPALCKTERKPVEA
jgi:uncharacterized protein (DUF4213/DUF364 family)